MLNDNLSIVPEASFGGSLEDINVYTLDAKILKVTNPALVAAAAAFVSESGRVPLSRALGELARHHRLRGPELYRGSVLVPE